MEILHVYIRVSDEKSVKKDNSLPAQELAGKRKAEQLGMDFKIHIEPGQSAAKDNLNNRPVLRNILDLCDDGEIKHLFVTEFDRLTRSPKTEFEIKLVLQQNDVLLHTTGQTYNFNDEEDDFISGILTLVAKREVKIKNKRIIRSLMESARKGRAGGGSMLPYGFTKDTNKLLVIEPEEKKTVEKIFQLSLSGVGSESIAHKLNEKGIPTRGKKLLKNGLKVTNKFTGKVTQKSNEELIWKAGTVIGILKNPIYKGERRFKGEVFPVPAIIAPEMWKKTQENLTKNKSYAGGNEKKHFYLLKGLLRCGKCGRNFYGYVKEKKSQRVYMCSSKREHFCGTKSINIEKLNNLVWDAVGGSRHLLNNLEAEIKNGKGTTQKIQLLQKQLKATDGKVKEIQAREDNLIDLFERSSINPEKFDLRNAKLKDELRVVEQEKNAISKEIAFLDRKENVKVLSVEFFEMVAGLANVSNEDKQKLLKAALLIIVSFPYLIIRLQKK